MLFIVLEKKKSIDLNMSNKPSLWIFVDANSIKFLEINTAY